MKNRLLTAVLVMALMVTGLAMPVAAYGAEEDETGTVEKVEEIVAETEEAISAEEPAEEAAEDMPAEPVDIEAATASEVEESYAYTGKAVTPEPIVTIETEDGEEIVLEEGQDYTVAYENGAGREIAAPLEAGDYQIVIAGTGEYTGTETVPFEIFMGKGWNKVDGQWYYYTADNVKLTNGWAQDSKGWLWLDGSGKAVKNKWIKKNGQWYYLKSDGHRAADEWAKDSKGWMWMNSNGQIAKKKWIKDGGEWYYLKANGYMAANEWTKDRTGWMYMNGGGRISKSRWIRSKGVWYYLKSNGYMAANEWAKDSSGWLWMNASGKMVDLKMGKPYVWGAAGPNSFDCSGYTMYIMRQQGVYLPHSAAGQYRALSSKNIGTDWHKAQPGDLVFYSYGGPGSSHHVGIYAGNGKLRHASSSHGRVVVTSVNFTSGHIAAICRP